MEYGESWDGEWLRRERVRRGLSQRELGALMNPPTAQTRISAWEHGKVPSQRTLRRLRDALGIVDPEAPQPQTLAEHREARGFSQDAVARRIRASRASVSAWERGTRAVPRVMEAPLGALLWISPGRVRILSRKARNEAQNKM